MEIQARLLISSEYVVNGSLYTGFWYFIDLLVIEKMNQQMNL